MMEKKQFDEFWEVKCPNCKKVIDIEILINLLGKKINEEKSKKK
jgi:phage FluMu protein Com